MSFDPRSLERLKELGRQLPKSIETPQPQPEAKPLNTQAQTNQSIWTLDQKLQQVKSPELRAALRRLGTPQEK